MGHGRARLANLIADHTDAMYAIEQRILGALDAAREQAVAAGGLAVTSDVFVALGDDDFDSVSAAAEFCGATTTPAGHAYADVVSMSASWSPARAA